MANSAAQPALWIRPVSGGTNPFTARFAGALREEGLLVRELPQSPLRWPSAPGLLVFHWPNEFFKHGSLRADLRTVAMLVRLRLRQRRCGKVVWVVHNIAPHEAGRLFAGARARFFKLLDGLIFLSGDSRNELLCAYPELYAKPYLITRHPDYRLDIRSSPTLPTIPERRVRLGMFGHLRRYKQPEQLARLVAAEPRAEVTIAGTCADSELQAELTYIAATAGNVTLSLEHLEEVELERLTDRANAVVLPYRAILNSGSALYALTRWRPVVAPRLGSLVELQRDVGPEWVHLYDGSFDDAVLADACVWAAQARKAPPDLSRYSWDAIGSELAAFLRSLA